MSTFTCSPAEQVWNPELYEIQLNAPIPKAFNRRCDIATTPPNFYGYEYHGEMDLRQAERLLSKSEDGTFLVRCSPSEKIFLLAVRFDRHTKHYRIDYKPYCGHHLKDQCKYFDRVYELVADCLVFFNMQKYSSSITARKVATFEQSPYMTMHGSKLNTEIRKSLNLENFDCKIDENDNNEDLQKVYEKKHKFKVYTFKGLNWCEYCSNFLWGLLSQGVKCDDCGFEAHVKCSEKVPSKCVPSLKRLRGIFGIDLTTLCDVHKFSIPYIVTRCVEEIEARGLYQDGIYRISGFSENIDNLKLAFDKNGDRTIISEKLYPNIHVVAGVLKRYLRLLPIPLITFHCYKRFMQTGEYKHLTDKIRCLRTTVRQLPPAHFECLKYLLNHLNRVAQHSAVNKMNEENLAIVFVPTLIFPPIQMSDLSQEITNLKLMIIHFRRIFY